MLLSRCPWLGAQVLLMLLVGSALAAAAKPDPLDASAAVAPVVPESAFQNYHRHADVSPRDWTATNDIVGRIGGWRAYAREAREANEPAAAAPRAPAASPGSHGGHGQPNKGTP